MIKIKKTILKKVYKKRGLESHKNYFGKLLIIGGNKIYSGAPALNALAAIKTLCAYRTGVDIVEVIAPKRPANIIAKFSPNIITYPLEGDFISKKHLRILIRESKNKTAFILGGGIGKEKQTISTVRNFLKKIKIPGVVDADGIYSIKRGNSKKERINLENFIITPHAYEFKILTGEYPLKNLNKRIKQVKKYAQKLNTTILLKGHTDIISNGKKTAINMTGNPYMTVGGTGDVLAGILGSLIAQRNDLFESACAAAYINGKAGELTKRKISLTATDIIEKIGKIVDKT